MCEFLDVCANEAASVALKKKRFLERKYTAFRDVLHWRKWIGEGGIGGMNAYGLSPCVSLRAINQHRFGRVKVQTVLSCLPHYFCNM